MTSNLKRLELKQTFSRLLRLSEHDSRAASNELQRLQEKNINIEHLLSLIDIQSQLGFTEDAQAKLKQVSVSTAWNIQTQLHYASLLLAFDQHRKFSNWKIQFVKKGKYEKISSDQKTRRDLLIAADAFASKQYLEAQKYYLLATKDSLQPQYEAVFGLIKTQQALGKREIAQQSALCLYKNSKMLTSRQSMTLAPLLYGFGCTDEALDLVQNLKDKEDSDALDLRNAMVIAMQAEHWSLAQSMGYETLLKASIPSSKTDSVIDNVNKRSLRTLYNDANDNWLTRNVLADIDSIQAREQSYISIGFDMSGRDGENQAQQVPIEALIAMPKYNGHLRFRADFTRLNSGDLNYDGDMDTSYTDDRADDINTKVKGLALGVGWLSDTWSMDIGSTPLGFNQQTLVGGMNISGDIGDFGWKATLSRRSESSSTLSYAGMTVPAHAAHHKNEQWGSVMRSGFKLGASYDVGGDIGYWSSVQLHKMSGDGVQDNTRLGILAGSYWKIVSAKDRRLSLGLNLMYLNYAKNLSEYSYDQGGYYSPPQYFSASIPVNYYQRMNERFSYLVSASVSNSWSQEDAPYGTMDDSTNGGGIGFSMQVAAEQRVSKRFYIGISMDIQRADFYQPNHLLVYVKYTFSDAWQSIAMPVDPLMLYADFD